MWGLVSKSIENETSHSRRCRNYGTPSPTAADTQSERQRRRQEEYHVKYYHDPNALPSAFPFLSAHCETLLICYLGEHRNARIASASAPSGASHESTCLGRSAARVTVGRALLLLWGRPAAEHWYTNN